MLKKLKENQHIKDDLKNIGIVVIISLFMGVPFVMVAYHPLY